MGHAYSGDLLDMSSLIRMIRNSKPDEVYYLAAQSIIKKFVGSIITDQFRHRLRFCGAQNNTHL
jgi:GDP-D-mannose dehydratase